MHPILSFSLRGNLERVSLPPVYSVGRAPTCDLVIEHPFVSALHCTFFIEPHGVALVDHESSNGTVVNGAVVRGKVALSAGDIIEVGPVVLTLSYAEETPTGPGTRTVPRPAIALGLAMKTQTEPPPQVRVILEVADGARRGDARLAFRDAVATRNGTVLLVGDLDPCADAGAVLGATRAELRSLAQAGASPGAIVTGLSSMLRRRGRSAQVLVARLEPLLVRAVWVCAHAGGPCVVHADGRLERLEGDRSPHPIGASDAPDTHENTTKLAPGAVFILPSTTLVSALRTMWDLDRPYLPRERRAAAVAIWLTNQAVRGGDGGSAVCAEIAVG